MGLSKTAEFFREPQDTFPENGRKWVVSADIYPDCVKLFNEQVNAFIAERWANADWKQTPNK